LAPIRVGIEEFLNRVFENGRYLERERQAWVVFSRFDGVDCLPRNAGEFGKICLRPSFLGAKHA
jgi:hypothetical protein